MSEATELAPGMQCCLRCGRVLTDRALHDSMEESMLYAIRARHPEWAQQQQQGAEDEASEASGECQPCLSEYRRLLGDRRTRAAQERLRRTPEAGGWLPSWVNRMLSRTRSDARA